MKCEFIIIIFQFRQLLLQGLCTRPIFIQGKTENKSIGENSVKKLICFNIWHYICKNSQLNYRRKIPYYCSIINFVIKKYFIDYNYNRQGSDNNNRNYNVIISWFGCDL